MESRILDACREGLAAQIAPRAQILDVATPAPYRCDLLLERSGSDASRARLVVDLSPAHPALYLARPIAVVSANEQLRRILAGRWITSVDRPVLGPVLRLMLAPSGGGEADMWLIFEWLGGSPGGVIVEAASSEVLATLGEPAGPARARRERGASYHWPASPHKPFYGRATAEQIRTILGSDGEILPARALARGLSGLPFHLSHEAVHRGARDPEALEAALHAIASEPIAPTLYAVPDPPAGMARMFVSPLRLDSLAPYEIKRPGTLFRMMETVHEATLRTAAEDQIRSAWSRLLSREEARLIRLREKLAEEIADASRAPELRSQAEAILIHLKQIARGSKQLECPDPKEPDRLLRIDLDPRVSVAANAEALFKRARRLEKGASLRARRIRALEDAIARLATLRADEAAQTKLLPPKGAKLLREALGPFVREIVVQAWMRDAASAGLDRRPAETGGRPRRSIAQSSRSGKGGGDRGAGASSAATADRRGEGRFHPRSFKTRDGWTVLVGRSNQENDHVTHRLAKPEDYWFHVHGCPGSHVVLRREGRKDNPSARTIEEVAAIAAFFSRARTSRKAPVIYTLKKYVRKARGGSPGLAIVTRERTIMVVPAAPIEAGPAGWGDEDQEA